MTSDISFSLSAKEIQSDLNTTFLGKEIHVFQELGSTNDLAKELALQGAPSGTAVLANRQTKGRGRMGRPFVSPPGVGIYLSILLRPTLPPFRLPIITLASGVAVAKAIWKVTQLKISLKWPNDLLLKEKKAGGILTEGKIEDNKMSFLVIGIGLNVNTEMSQFPDDLLPLVTSLRIEKGQLCSRVDIVREILRQMEETYLQLETGQEEAILKDWSAISATLGKWIRVSSPTGLMEGLAERVDEKGALILQKKDGETVRVTAGEVTILKDAQ